MKILVSLTWLFCNHEAPAAGLTRYLTGALVENS